MKRWIKVKDDHPWLKDKRVGIIASMEEGQRDRWYSANGKEWDGGFFVPIEDWTRWWGYEECTEAEAKEFLKKNT
jgi:hypothetical protein